LVALAGDDPTTAHTARLFQHRFLDRSDGTRTDLLAGHAVGNLLLCGLIEMHGDPVAGLDHAAALVRAAGRVLPMSNDPVGIEADVRGADPTRPDEVTTVRGQHEVAVTPGRVLSVRLAPPSPPACPQAVAAVGEADWLIFGPGSWYTSVIPHLLVPDLARAIVASRAARLVTLNLAAEPETLGLSLAGHLAALAAYLPALTVDAVLADGKAVGDPEPVRRAAESLGARLVLAPVAVADGDPRHDPAALAAALVPVLGSAR
ncbi:MAG TPA: 2-phospho-L-lactate transferase CofD family protein, partial [Micromonosporaceae bacterium]|nr:2-phospho-L-lactate transferase CofD family protein [Micromonosporaceae bacterium]